MAVSRQAYKRIGFIFTELIPVDVEGNQTTDTAATDARAEFDRQLTEAQQQYGELIQLLDYAVFDHGGCEDEYGTVIDRTVTIRATGVFRKD